MANGKNARADAVRLGARARRFATAFTLLGERETGPERLEQAVAAFGLALQVITRDRVPLQWAQTQMSLGGCCRRWASASGGPRDRPVEVWRERDGIWSAMALSAKYFVA